MFRPLRYILDRLITTGDLNLIDADDRNYGFGDHSGPPVVARIADKWTEIRLALNPMLAIGEAYMDGRLIIEQGTIYDLLEIILKNLAAIRWPPWLKLIDDARSLTRPLQNYNPVRRAKRNVAHHYDLDGSLYDLFLDADRLYSCAYFETDRTPLDEAQAAKKRHLAAKLNLRDGLKILDIGSGWGGLALYLAQTAHVEVTGITLSDEQLKISRERARAMGLSLAVKFELCDYRNLEGKFDRIVSVGMFEHVGTTHYRSFFDKIGKLLGDD
ncbi:MAG TPA: cyclopropane-fatty-acyl-phospholipid synthase family protein, partial [Methyloceanibacter sp.]|nr:cyclopropane-fatty-acyl-phospholipid synthase family protein [Methyloceanibacter sp.]